MRVRLMTAVVWILVAASVLAWARRFVEPPPAAPVQAGTAVVETVPVASPAALLRLLGAAAASNSAQDVPPGDARFRLLGVIADPRGQGFGVALIALDQQAARPYRVGARVEGDLLLQSVGARTASLGGKQGPALFTLALPNPSELPAGTPSAVAAVSPMVLPVVPPAVSTPPGAQPGPAQTAPLPAPAAAVPSVRMAAPGEMVEPGRRRRLRGSGPGPQEPGTQ